MNRPTRLGLRTRVTVAATLIAAVGLAAMGVLIVIVLERALLSGLEETAHGRGRDIAALVDSDQLTEPLPSFGASVAQVIDQQARVRASTPGGDRLAPIVGPDDLSALREGEAVDLDGNRLGTTEPLRVVGEPAGPPGDRQTVVVAVSLTEHERSMRLAKLGIAAGTVALTGALGLSSWMIAGRALRPVDQLRTGAETITGADAAQRLPVPAGEDELSRLAVTLNDMLDRLDAASNRQRAFIADAAHELRSPVATLKTQLEVTLVHPDAADPAETVNDALAEVTRMERLVDDLLVLAHLDDPRPVHMTEALDLRRIAVETAERETATGVHVKVTPGSPVHAVGHPDSLTRVVRNLVDNAVRHAVEEVTISVESDARHAILAVTDDGEGVAPADRERIFERFARLDDARDRDAGGTGLGLAIAREIAMAHGGSLDVEGAASGARFVLRLRGAPST